MRRNSIIFKQHCSHKWGKDPFACVKNEENNDPVFVFLFSFYEKLSIHFTSATSLIAPLFFAEKRLQPRNVCFRLIFVSYNILYTILIAHRFSPPVSSSIFFSCQLAMRSDLRYIKMNDSKNRKLFSILFWGAFTPLLHT